MREELERTLGEGGYDILLMESGDELVEYLGRAAVYPGALRMPDLIISDVRMPGYSGLQVVKAIRDVRWLAIPVILVTAFGEAELHEEARALGVIATFDKPFDPDDLLATVAATLGR
jgi:CheY-like chemotaxis protein